jgi:outer membrane lipoprotein-sorting protein
VKNRFFLKIIGLSALAVLFLQGLAFQTRGDELSVEDVLKNFQKTFAEIMDYTVLLQVKTDIQQIRVPQRNVKVYFKQPDRLHLQSKGFAMLPKEGMFINPNRFNRKDYYMSLLGMESLNGRSVYKLELVPRNEKLRVRKLTLWIDSVRWVALQINSVTWQGQSIAIQFDHEKFQDKYWLPVKVTATVDLKEFKGFSSFHDSHGWEDESKSAEGSRPGNIIIQFSDYVINGGIPDSIFEEE